MTSIATCFFIWACYLTWNVRVECGPVLALPLNNETRGSDVKKGLRDMYPKMLNYLEFDEDRPTGLGFGSVIFGKASSFIDIAFEEPPSPDNHYFCLTFYVKPLSENGGTLFSFQTDCSSMGGVFMEMWIENNDLKVHMENHEGTVYTKTLETSAVTVGTWKFFSVVRDGPHKFFRLMVDGAQESYYTPELGNETYNTFVYPAVLRVGASKRGRRPFDGKMTCLIIGNGRDIREGTYPWCFDRTKWTVPPPPAENVEMPILSSNRTSTTYEFYGKNLAPACNYRSIGEFNVNIVSDCAAFCMMTEKCGSFAIRNTTYGRQICSMYGLMSEYNLTTSTEPNSFYAPKICTKG